MVGQEQEDAVKYDDITSITPVGKIIKITNTNPAKIHFSSYDFSKFKQGDMVYITRQKAVPGYEIFNMQTFALDNANDKDLNFFLKTSENKTVDASHLQYEVKDGFAQIVGEAAPVEEEQQKKPGLFSRKEADEPSSRKDAKSPSRV